MNKICSFCKEKKNITEFNKNKYTHIGFLSLCKDCQSKRYRDWYIKNGRKNRKPLYKNFDDWYNSSDNKIKAQCRNKILYHLKIRDITKPINCNRCNRKTYLVAHHSDYSKPLEVEWLCSSCHKKHHLKNNVKLI